MPRKARIDAPGALHHIIIRGIERKSIFKDSADRKNFTERLNRIIPETQTRCYGWALMTNHVHLLFKTGMAPLATVMRRLLTGYAVTFNRRHRRHGQLFQNRYGKQGGESGQQTIGDWKNPETGTKYLISIEVNEKTKPINI